MKRAFEIQGKVEKLKVLASMQYMSGPNATGVTISKVLRKDEIRYLLESTETLATTVIAEEVIRQEHPWAISLLPLMKLTPKQEDLLWLLRQKLSADNTSAIYDFWKVDEWKALVDIDDEDNSTEWTTRKFEGTLSSLWVKGYIQIQYMVFEKDEPAERVFTLTPIGAEQLWRIKGSTVVDFEEDDLDDEE